MKKAVVRQSDGKVVNVIEIEEGANWTPPKGHELRVGGAKDDKWDGTEFIKRYFYVEPVIQKSTEEKLEELKQRVEVLEKG